MSPQPWSRWNREVLLGGAFAFPVNKERNIVILPHDLAEEYITRHFFPKFPPADGSEAFIQGWPAATEIGMNPLSPDEIGIGGLALYYVTLKLAAIVAPWTSSKRAPGLKPTIGDDDE